MLAWVFLLGDRREAALRCARMPIAVALFSAIRDFWAGVRGGGLVCWEGFRVLEQVFFLVFWEEGSRLVAGAVVGVDCVDGLEGAGREGGGGGGGTADSCATVCSIWSILSSNVRRSCDNVEVRLVTVLRSV